MNDRYFFDKRQMKRTFGKYAIIFFISFVPLILFNLFISKYIEGKWTIILIDSVILLGFVWIGNKIANKIFEKKDRKLAAKIMARQEADARKNQILQDSYRKKRLEKQKNKTTQENVVEVEEFKENSQPVSIPQKLKTTKSTSKKTTNKSSTKVNISTRGKK